MFKIWRAGNTLNKMVKLTSPHLFGACTHGVLHYLLLDKTERVLLCIIFGYYCYLKLWYWTFGVVHQVVVIYLSVPEISAVYDSSISMMRIWISWCIVLLTLTHCGCICFQYLYILCFIWHYIRCALFKTSSCLYSTPLKLLTLLILFWFL